MDSSLGLNIFTVLFLSGTFLAALVAGLGGFAFGIVAAAVWLYILTPLQTATLIMCLGLVVQGYSVWKLRHALSWRRLAPLLVGPHWVYRLAYSCSRMLIRITFDSAPALCWYCSASTDCCGRP
jgi:hypothetical protein